VVLHPYLLGAHIIIIANVGPTVKRAMSGKGNREASMVKGSLAERQLFALAQFRLSQRNFRFEMFPASRDASDAASSFGDTPCCSEEL
jgi:hypothetical protein